MHLHLRVFADTLSQRIVLDIIVTNTPKLLVINGVGTARSVVENC